MFLLHGLIRMTNILIQWSSDTNQAYKYYVINIDTENMLVQSVYQCTQEIVIRLKKKSNFLKWKFIETWQNIFKNLSSVSSVLYVWYKMIYWEYGAHTQF